jgi:hypothetical protein
MFGLAGPRDEETGGEDQAPPKARNRGPHDEETEDEE